MASLCDKVKITLDETRMLVLGTQVLISLQFELAFQGGFPQAPQLAQQLVPVGLALLLATFILLLWGPAYHRIVARGHCNEESLAFMTRAICGALWPLAFALALDSFIAFDLLVGMPAAIAAAVMLLILCAGLWYVMAAMARWRRPLEARCRWRSPRRASPWPPRMECGSFTRRLCARAAPAHPNLSVLPHPV